MFGKSKLCKLIMDTKRLKMKRHDEETRKRKIREQNYVDKNKMLVEEFRTLWHDFVKKHQKELANTFAVSKCLSDNFGWNFDYQECFRKEKVKELEDTFEMRIHIHYKEDKSVIPYRDLFFAQFTPQERKRYNEPPENDYFVVSDPFIDERNFQRGEIGIFFMFTPNDTENNMFITKRMIPLEQYLNEITESEYPLYTYDDIFKMTNILKAFFIAFENYKEGLEEYVEDGCKREKRRLTN